MARSFTQTISVNQANSGYQFKTDRAKANETAADPAQSTNSDVLLAIDRSGTDYNYAIFSKTMTHNSRGEVSAADASTLTDAVESGSGFSTIPQGGARKFVNPQAAFAYVTTGLDPHSASIAVPPSLTSRTMASEMAEVYEHALNRDSTFDLIESATPDTDADRAVTVLNSFGSDFLGPKDGGLVTRKTLFRGIAQGCELGPYISQFLYQDIPYGDLDIVQKYDEETGSGHGTTLAEYLDIQNGVVFDPESDRSGVFKYIHTPRVLGSFVHRDPVVQAYLNAALILIGVGAAADQNDPYLSNTREEGFVTFGIGDVLPSVSWVASLALKAAWVQKWAQHLRIRPEVMACRVHHQDIADTNYGIHADLMSSSTLTAIKALNVSGTALLPLQYPEGSPAHPSYPAGHSVVAGACVTVLKALFDESVSIPSLMTVYHSTDGSSLAAYSGSTAGMTVGTELNKLAANIAIGRDWAGVHYRSDGDYGMELGEKMAIAFLKDQLSSYHEDSACFNLTKFDGTSIKILAS